MRAKSHVRRLERAPTRRRKASQRRARRETKIDESVEESFPASDPPTWDPPVRIGRPRRS